MPDERTRSRIASLRARLTRPLDIPYVHGTAPSTVGPTEDLLTRFSDELEATGGRFFRAGTQDELDTFLARELGGLTGKRIITPDTTGTDQHDYDIGITHAAFLVAETGTVVELHASKAACRASLLPRTHIVIARYDQIVPNLSTLLVRLAPRLNSRDRTTAILITGPSRTADIEKVLVMPAHGPAELFVLLLDPGVRLNTNE